MFSLYKSIINYDKYGNYFKPRNNKVKTYYDIRDYDLIFNNDNDKLNSQKSQKSQSLYSKEYSKQYGGEYVLNSDQKLEVGEILKGIDNNQPGYVELENAVNGNGVLSDEYNDYHDVKNKLNSMLDQTLNLQNISPEREDAMIDNMIKNINTKDNSIKEIIIPPGEKPYILSKSNRNNGNDNITKTMYETIEPGTILYHPTQDVSRLGHPMLFVDITKVLDKNKQRSFCMFFTKNEEYAKRFSGLWSLNKRPVYVHKLKVKQGKPITGIKILDSHIIPSNIDNTELAKKISGPSEDGTINGIKIAQKLDNNTPIDEYYICNPETLFDTVETWMQLGATEWIKITPDNVKTIQVPNDEPNSHFNTDARFGEFVL